MLNRMKSILVAGAVVLGAVAFAGGAQAGVGGVAGVAKKAAISDGGAVKAQTVHYRRICRPIFRSRWTPYGWRRVFVGRRCFNRPHRHYHRPYWRRGYNGWGRPGWRRHRGWRRGGPSITFRFGR